MCLATFFEGFGTGGSTMLGARDEASETVAKSLKPVDVGGTGNEIAVGLDAVLLRRWNGSSFILSGGELMTP
jgi:hypothetical protein